MRDDGTSPLLDEVNAILVSVLEQTEETDKGPVGPLASEFRIQFEDSWETIAALVSEGLIEQDNNTNRYRLKLRAFAAVQHRVAVEIVENSSRIFAVLRASFKEKRSHPVPISSLESLLALPRAKISTALVYMRDESTLGAYSTDLSDANASVAIIDSILLFNNFGEVLSKAWRQYSSFSNHLVYRLPEAERFGIQHALLTQSQQETEADISPITSMVSADRPIMSESDDRLRRSHFSKKLASTIANWRGQESLVIALYGAWGTGKTSIKNLVVDAIGRETQSPEVLEFNPWQWSGHDALSTAFFAEISKKLKRGLTHQQLAKLSTAFNAYSSFLEVNKKVLSNVPKLVVLVVMLLAATGLGVSFIDLTPAAVELAQRLLFAVLAVVALLGMSKDILKVLAEWLGQKARLNEKTLSELKTYLADELRRLDKRYLIVIDDIDRLSASEIRAVFQLVKANADFPNFIYLLPFSRSVAATALSDIAGGDGDGFLEKIVQIGFDVPEPDRRDIDRALSEKLEVIFRNEVSKKRFDQSRWIDVYHGGLHSYFSNLRDVNRFAASLAFYVQLLRTANTLDVNPIDLIVVEALRLFEPDAYARLRSSKELLIGGSPSHAADRDRVAGDVRQLAQSARHRQAALQELIKQLFPNKEWAFGGTNYTPDYYETWRKDLRICCRDIFDRYFAMQLPEGEVSEADIEKLLAAASDSALLMHDLRALLGRNQLRNALEGLSRRVDDIDPQHASGVITVLFEIGESLPPHEPEFFATGPEWVVQRIVKRLLLRMSQEERATILENAIHGARGLSMAVMRVSLECDRDSNATTSPALSTEDAQRLRDIMLRRIRDASKDGSLRLQRDLGMIIYRWAAWTSDQEPRDWIRTLIETDEGLLVYLKALVQKSASHNVGSHAISINHYIPLEGITRFSDICDLARRVGNLSAGPMSSLEDQNAIDAFHETLRQHERAAAEPKN